MADWNGQKVIVKTFCHKWLARRQAYVEWKSLQRLNSLRLSCAKPLFYGKTGNGDWVCVIAAIPNSIGISAIFQSDLDEHQRLDVLLAVAQEVAKQHVAGAMQKDIHLGNFLYDGKQIYSIDTAKMRFYRKPIGTNGSLAMLGVLCTNLPDEAEKMAQTYFLARGRQDYKTLLERLYRCIEQAKAANLRQILKKTMRDSKWHYRFEDRELSGMFSRLFCPPAEAAGFASQIDGLMEEGEILKDGNSSFVSRVKWNKRDVVIKRYNHNGFRHSFRHTLKGSRAKRGWLNAHRLLELGVGTPPPLAFVEKRHGPLLYCSYIVNEFADGPKLHEFLNNANLTEQERINTIEQTKKLLDRLHKHRITHGDLKPSNIIVTKNGPVLLDLDSIKYHRLGVFYRHFRAKDLNRLALP